MSSEHHRFLEARTLAANLIPERTESHDFGAYRVLQVDVYVHKAGTGNAGGLFKLQHAAVNEPDRFRDIAGAAWVVDSTAGNGAFKTITDHLRYIRWVTDSNVAGAPVVSLDPPYRSLSLARRGALPTLQPPSGGGSGVVYGFVRREAT
jgi:hypothetical protein